MDTPFPPIRAEELRIMGFRPATSPEGKQCFVKERNNGGYSVELADGSIGILDADEFEADGWVIDPIEGANNMGVPERLWVAVASAIRAGSPELFTGDVADFPDLIPANVFQAIADAGFTLEETNQLTELAQPAGLLQSSDEENDAATD